MALFDDRRFLLSHINHSFITGDDTGICEVVMLDEDVFENQHQRCLRLDGQDNLSPQENLDQEAYDLDYESELFESEQGQSYDIASDLDYICHRRRSNTAQRLEKLDKEKKNQSLTTTIVWRCNSPSGSNQDDLHASAGDQAGDNKNPDNLKRRPRNPPRKSGLTKLLERFPSLPKNPFDEFAQFDGGMSETVPVKKIMIFIAINHHQSQQQQQLQQQIQTIESSKEGIAEQPATPTILAPSAKDVVDGAPAGSKALAQHLTPRTPKKSKNNDPLEVVIVSTAKVQDLIGLICWQYTNEGRDPKLHQDIKRYCLRIAEDNGEVDPDFPNLNPKEPLSKFNFPSLALTEKMEERIPSYKDQLANGTTTPVYGQRAAPNNIASETKVHHSGGRFAVITRMIFKDAKLDTSQ